VPLLELANIRGRKAAGLAAEEEMAQGEATGTLSTQMTTWVHLRQNFEKRRGGEEKPAAGPQAIAWSDPSDLLSWRVPGVEGLALSNVHVRNTKWWWLIASPSAAHANYASNKNVLRMMLGPRASSAESEVGEYDLNHQESTLAVPSSGVWSR
jgi:hypothetical protein